MRLNTVSNARASLATLIRKRERGEIQDDDFKALVYGLNTLLAYLKTEADMRIEERLEAVEEALRANQ